MEFLHPTDFPLTVMTEPSVDACAAVVVMEMEFSFVMVLTSVDGKHYQRSQNRRYSRGFIQCNEKYVCARDNRVVNRVSFLKFLKIDYLP